MRVAFKKGWYKRFFLVCGALLLAIAAFTQPNLGRGRSGGPEEGEDGATRPEIDTSRVFYFFAENPNLEIPFSDSLLDNNFQQYDPVRQRDLDYAHLGNMGSAHRPIWFEVPFRRGFDVGLHQFDLYMTEAKDLPFYRLEKPFTRVYFMQGAEQADVYFKGQFSRNFANGVNVSLDYKRISFLGNRLQFQNQNTRNTALATGIWYHHPSNQYDGFLSFSTNAIQQQDNGGLQSDTIQGTAFESPSAYPVFLQNAETRHSHNQIAYTHYYKFGGQIDSTNKVSRSYTLFHQFLYETNNYKFSDIFPSSDTSYFRMFEPFYVDLRGVRHFLEHDRVENSFRVSTFKLDANDEAAAKNQRDLLEFGITHTYHVLREEPRDSTINNLFATGRIRFNPSERLLADIYGHFGILDNVGDYRLSGTLFVDFKKLGQLRIMAINQLYSPNLIQHRFFVAQQKIWDNNFERTLSTNIQGSYILPQFELEVSGGYHLINNYIYYDNLAIPQQTGVPISIVQLMIKKNFRVWNFHLDNIITLQESSEDFIRLPTFYTKHSLYYEGNWFKVLLVRVGFDLRLNNDYFAYYYQPLTGQFILQNEREVVLYPATDAFFSMKVDRFRAFFKWENFTRPDELFYQTAFYPHSTTNFRLGVSWRFTN